MLMKHAIVVNEYQAVGGHNDVSVDDVVAPQQNRGRGNMPHGLSIIIPAYNEEKGLGLVLTQLSQVLTGSGLSYEVIVVDDGSHDDTASIAEQHLGVTLVRHQQNRGYGAALKTGIRRAHFDLICTIDADGTYPAGIVPDLVERLIKGNYDMVVGARTGDNLAVPLVRRPAKWAIGRLANFVAGQSIPDPNSGLRVFRRAAALQLFSVLPNGFSFTTTITLALLTNGYLVNYVPVNYYARVGRSKIRPIRDTLNFVQLTLRIALYFAPLKIFLSLSALLFMLALGWALFSLFVLGRLADVSTLVVVMAAIQVSVVGMLAELINRRLPNYYREE
jgi:glycosyltransferase involved in cell wall biosynthesis